MRSFFSLGVALALLGACKQSGSDNSETLRSSDAAGPKKGLLSAQDSELFVADVEKAYKVFLESQKSVNSSDVDPMGPSQNTKPTSLWLNNKLELTFIQPNKDLNDFVTGMSFQVNGGLTPVRLELERGQKIEALNLYRIAEAYRQTLGRNPASSPQWFELHMSASCSKPNNTVSCQLSAEFSGGAL
jgi:hypothetical protein